MNNNLLSKYTLFNIYIYIYIYIYIVFFNPVNPEKGTIPSGQSNYPNFEYLNIPGKEINVNKFTEQILFQEKTKFIHIRIVSLFPFIILISPNIVFFLKLYIYIYIHSESNVLHYSTNVIYKQNILQYSGILRKNSAVPDAFTKVVKVKVTNHIGL